MHRKMESSTIPPNLVMTLTTLTKTFITYGSERRFRTPASKKMIIDEEQPVFDHFICVCGRPEVHHTLTNCSRLLKQEATSFDREIRSARLCFFHFSHGFNKLKGNLSDICLPSGCRDFVQNEADDHERHKHFAPRSCL